MQKSTEHIEDGLLIRFINDEVSNDERIKIENWIAESEQNKKYFSDLKLTWKKTGQYYDKEKSWDAVTKKIASDHQVPEYISIDTKKSYISSPLFKIAASLIIVAGIAAILFVLSNDNNNQDESISQNDEKEKLIQNDVENKADLSNTVEAIPEIIKESNFEQLTCKLEDGSVIDLNAASKIIYNEDFGVKNRAVYFEGEGFFDVERNPDLPFVITTEKVIITVLGTSFYVNTLGDKTKVIVESGTVHVTSVMDVNKQVILEKGMTACLTDDNNLVSKSTSGNNHLTWKTGMFVFDETPLKNVIEDLMDYKAVIITIEDESLLNETLSGTFTISEFDMILETVALTCNAEIIRNESGIVLKSK
jgi:ferric-dicitrate binding protein FerR (iron transport regulator)